jgi:hypothetical protein
MPINISEEGSRGEFTITGHAYQPLAAFGRSCDISVAFSL